MTRLLSTRNCDLNWAAHRIVGAFKRVRHTVVASAVIAVATLSPAATLGQFDLSEIGYDGFAEASDDIMVSAFESGRVESVAVKVGDRVKAGQVLATLEHAAQRIAVEAAETVATMRGGIDLATADQALHEMRFNQLKALASKGNARSEEVDRAKAELEMSVARFLNAKEEIAQREVDLKLAREQLRRRQVISPVDGVVAKIFVESGEYVLPSDLTVVRVINTSGLKAVFNVPAAEAIRMSIGQVVRVEFTSIARSAEGTVDTISPLIDADSGTIPVTVRIDNSSQRWMAGDRCLMDPAVRPKPNRTSVITPATIDVATEDQKLAAKPGGRPDRVAVIVMADSVRITDLPLRSSTDSPIDQKKR
jgi:RND family efflux transporter MFP subunit